VPEHVRDACGAAGRTGRRFGPAAGGPASGGRAAPSEGLAGRPDRGDAAADQAGGGGAGGSRPGKTAGNTRGSRWGVSDERAKASEEQERLQEILLSYVEAAEAGAPPDRLAFVKAHPDFAAEIAEFLADYHKLNRMVTPLRDSGACLAG